MPANSCARGRTFFSSSAAACADTICSRNTEIVSERKLLSERKTVHAQYKNSWVRTPQSDCVQGLVHARTRGSAHTRTGNELLHTLGFGEQHPWTHLIEGRFGLRL